MEEPFDHHNADNSGKRESGGTKEGLRSDNPSNDGCGIDIGGGGGGVGNNISRRGVSGVLDPDDSGDRRSDGQSQVTRGGAGGDPEDNRSPGKRCGTSRS